MDIINTKQCKHIILFTKINEWTVIQFVIFEA